MRSSLLEIGKLCSESRKIALDCGKAIATKKRVPKEAKSSDKELPESSPVLERADGAQSAEAAVFALAPVKKPRGRKPKIVPVPVAAISEV